MEVPNKFIQFQIVREEGSFNKIYALDDKGKIWIRRDPAGWAEISNRMIGVNSDVQKPGKLNKAITT